MFWLFFVSLTLFSVASYARLKTSQYIGAQPPPGTAIYTAYILFGGGLSTLAIVALVGLGFFTFAWWVPIVSVAAAAFLSGIIYTLIPAGATLVIVSFPLGLVALVFTVLTRVTP